MVVLLYILSIQYWYAITYRAQWTSKKLQNWTSGFVQHNINVPCLSPFSTLVFNSFHLIRDFKSFQKLELTITVFSGIKHTMAWHLMLKLYHSVRIFLKLTVRKKWMMQNYKYFSSEIQNTVLHDRTPCNLYKHQAGSSKSIKCHITMFMKWCSILIIWFTADKYSTLSMYRIQYARANTHSVLLYILNASQFLNSLCYSINN